ncbi:ABC proline/glycine betaine family protein transporter, periplasmic ligand binding protein [Sphingobium indicum BiD32]|uniref:ABC proline/glycine betaine family protein transporter, periplasmic ligand binding protein n=1 Tax=Sphingobium indicum BiD32 TaxID=1301087 RepID=N1MMZ8_9SPHN|nr:glycine betaine ABC transporter substrate-binding protein [Sphingobium indicum]CCW18331.1 ABC proline/glycine betaine family protein transporter, periplasmic ligand binding protein [Sphingobium indicum BiD32]
MNAPIRIGHIDLSFHDASARELERVLEAHGERIEHSAAPHEEMFRRLGAGEVDMLVSAWLRASHGAYLAPFEDQVRKVTILYEPYCIWGVPEHVPKDAVASVSDLLKPPALERMDRLIQGINPGAGISRFSAAMVERYGLAEAGYHFRPGTEAECFDRFEAAMKDARWVVVPLWHPQFLHARYRIRALVEPLGLLGGTDQATLLVRRDAEARIGTAALDELSRLHLGNARVSALDDMINKENAA